MHLYQFQFNNINTCYCYKQLETPPPSPGVAKETLKGEEETRAIGGELIAKSASDQLSHYVKNKMPAVLRNADNIALFSRKLLDSGYDKDTIIKIEIAEDDDIYYVLITLNNETYKGGIPVFVKNAEDKAFRRALKDIKPNKLKKLDKKASNKLEEFSNYIKDKVPADLDNPNNIAILSRKLLDSGYDKDTIIKIEIVEDDDIYYVLITLNNETYKGGIPVFVKNAKDKAFAQALRDIG